MLAEHKEQVMLWISDCWQCLPCLTTLGMHSKGRSYRIFMSKKIELVVKGKQVTDIFRTPINIITP